MTNIEFAVWYRTEDGEDILRTHQCKKHDIFNGRVKSIFRGYSVVEYIETWIIDVVQKDGIDNSLKDDIINVLNTYLCDVVDEARELLIDEDDEYE